MAPHEPELIGRLAIALALGAVIGLERELNQHPAGLRTMAMVAMGSCLFTLAGAYVIADRVDPTRVAAQVVTGIGFLGAGAILRSGTSIRGLTTAATIWVVAAIGMAVAFGLYLVSLASTLLVIIALVAIRQVEIRVVSRYKEPEDRD